MPLSQLRQAITRLILPTADLGLREQTVDPLLFPDDLPPILAINAGQSAAGPKLQALGVNGGLLQAVAPEGNTITTGQTALTTVPALLVPANPNRYALYLINNSGATPVFIGTSALTQPTGFLIITNGSVTLRTGAAIWALVNSGVGSISWLEESP